MKGELRELDDEHTGKKEMLVRAVVMVSVEDAQTLTGHLYQEVEIRPISVEGNKS